MTPQFKALLPVATRPIFGAEPRELSLLFVLFYVASSGNAQNPGTFERNFNTRGGAQQDRFVGGSQRIALLAAHHLGKRVVLSSPVRTIEQHKGTVTVHSDRMIVRAKHAIVAMPPVLAGRIHYASGLPSGRHQLTDRFPQGTLTKVAAVYDRPFWRDQGLTGQVLSTAGPVSATFDDSPPSGKPGIVFGFVGGDEARKYNASSPASRRAAVLGQFKELLRPAGAHAAGVLRHDLDRRAMDPRLPGRDPDRRHAVGARPAPEGTGRPHPLGRHGNERLLEWLHGRRGALGRAGGVRSARRAVGSRLRTGTKEERRADGDCA